MWIVYPRSVKTTYYQTKRYITGRSRLLALVYLCIKLNVGFHIISLCSNSTHYERRYTVVSVRALAASVGYWCYFDGHENESDSARRLTALERKQISG